MAVYILWGIVIFYGQNSVAIKIREQYQLKSGKMPEV